MAEKIFLNDKIIDSKEGSISVTESGFLYGAGLFETMRSSNGVVFSLNEHLDRLYASAEALQLKVGYERQYIKDAIYQVLQANELSDARIRLTLTAGALSESDNQRKETMLITATRFLPYPPEYYQKGVLVVLSRFRQNANDQISGHKTTSYFSRMLELKTAHEKGAAESLWFTTENYLAEGCVSNVFFVKDAVLYTPRLQTPVLPGIARKTVCKLAGENSIGLIEKDLTIDDLLAADEIFLTNVIMQVLPVVQVEKHIVSEGKVGAVTKKMHYAYQKYLNDNCTAK